MHQTAREFTPQKPGLVNVTMNTNNYMQPAGNSKPTATMPNSNNGSQPFGVEGSSLGKKKAPQQSLLTQHSNPTIVENSTPTPIEKPAYTIMQYPQTQVKGPSYKQ